MLILYGTAFLAAGILLIAGARAVTGRWANLRTLGFILTGEVSALAITILLSVGTILIAQGMLATELTVGLAELAGAAAALAVLATITWRWATHTTPQTA